MKFEDIKPGKKYFHTTASNSLNKRTASKERITKTIFVLETDKQRKRVCGSINGAPAEWFDGNSYARWTKENPELETA